MSPVAGGAGAGEYGVEHGLGERPRLDVLLAASGVYNSFTEVAGMTVHKPKRVWSVADAQANLTEVLRLSESEGPQYIEAAGTFVVTPVKPAQDRDEPELTLGQWLVKNAPRGANLVIPRDRCSNREIPFIDEGDE